MATESNLPEFSRDILGNDGTAVVNRLLGGLHYFRHYNATATSDEVATQANAVKSLLEVLQASKYDEDSCCQEEVVEQVVGDMETANLLERLMLKEIGMLTERRNQLEHAIDMAKRKVESELKRKKRLAAEAAKLAADTETAEK